MFRDTESKSVAVPCARCSAPSVSAIWGHRVCNDCVAAWHLAGEVWLAEWQLANPEAPFDLEKPRAPRLGLSGAELQRRTDAWVRQAKARAA